MDDNNFFYFLEIKLEKFLEAVEDCTAVLKLEPLNIKGLQPYSAWSNQLSHVVLAYLLIRD